jgi:hypothetical protein
MSRARTWPLLAILSMLASACGSQPADPKALPSWIAAYPGSNPQPVGSAFVFYTQDPAEKVLDFYEQQLAQNGVHKEARGGGEYGGFLSAADDSHSRNVMIEVGPPSKGAAAVSITVPAKK